MKKHSFLLLILVLLAGNKLNAQTPVQSFFSTLQSLCGQRFLGEMTFPQDGQDNFAGQVLLAEFSQCSEHELRIPFLVGDDASRTWIITQTEQGLRLKHKHLLKDGSIDPVSNYGGDAIAAGSALSQSFPADAFTQELIPDAATNVWTLSFSEDSKQMTYHLERHGKPRFTAEFELESVKAD